MTHGNPGDYLAPLQTSANLAKLLRRLARYVERKPVSCPYDVADVIALVQVLGTTEPTYQSENRDDHPYERCWETEPSEKLCKRFGLDFEAFVQSRQDYRSLLDAWEWQYFSDQNT